MSLRGCMLRSFNIGQVFGSCGWCHATGNRPAEDILAVELGTLVRLPKTFVDAAGGLTDASNSSPDFVKFVPANPDMWVSLGA